MVKTDRIRADEASPGAIKAMMALEEHIRTSSLDRSLIELVKMRASQINGCAVCLDLHSKKAREAGETEQRLYLLSAWRESSLYTPRERAALEWTEALTEIAQGHPSDGLFGQVHAHFDDKQLTDLTLLIVLINGWNRLVIGFGYQHD